jgi:hypothetical protein
MVDDWAANPRIPPAHLRVNTACRERLLPGASQTVSKKGHFAKAKKLRYSLALSSQTSMHEEIPMPTADPTSFDKAVEAHVHRQAGQLQKAIADAIEENASLKAKLAAPQPSIDELDATLVLFGNFAATYYTTILKLVSPRDHKRLSTALAKIQTEIFVLRRLVEQRTSDNLRPMLRIADHWCNTYLISLLGKGTDPAGASGLRRSKVVVGDYPSADPAGAAVIQPSNSPYRNWCLVFFEGEHVIRLGKFAYNRNPSISMPLVHAYEPWNWLGMAHEIGHFVFHNTHYVPDSLQQNEANGGEPAKSAEPLAIHVRKSILRSLTQRYLDTDHSEADCMGVAQSLPLWCAWSEELFADLLGAITLGPTYVESLATYIAPRLAGENELLEDDGDHPVACLRPVLQILVHLKLLDNMEASRSGGALVDAGLVQLREELKRIAAQWCVFCESRFEVRPEDFAERAEKLNLATSRGLYERLLLWGDCVPRRVGAVPFALLLNQVDAIAGTFARDVLNCVPLYDGGAYQLTKTLAANVAEAFETIGSGAGGLPSAQPAELSSAGLPIHFVHLLGAQWRRQAQIASSVPPQQEEWISIVGRWSEKLAADAENSTLAYSLRLGLPAAEAMIIQLLDPADDKRKEWLPKVQRVWGTDIAPDEQALEIADWLLSISFATEELSGICGTGREWVVPSGYCFP